MNDSILLVDDDARVVSAMQRSLHRAYCMEIAAGSEDDLLADDGEPPEECGGLSAEQLIYRPIAEEVLRSLRS